MNNFARYSRFLFYFVVINAGFIKSARAQKIVLHFDAPPGAVAIRKAAFKYDKDFAYSLTLDDCTLDHYSVVFPLFKGGKMDDGLTYPGMFQTDGCGGKLPFKGGLAWNSVNPILIDVHVGNVAWYMLWSQLDEMYAAGWDVFNHSYSHKAKATSPNIMASDYPNEIKLNAEAVRNRTAQRIEMQQFVVPSGDTGYYQPVRDYGIRITYNQDYRLPGASGGLNVTAPQDFQDFYLARTNIDPFPVSTAPIDLVASKSVKGDHYWHNEFLHIVNSPGGTLTNGQPFSEFKKYMSYIESTYGAKGSDRIWFAPLQEVSEYLALRDVAVVASNTAGTATTVDLGFGPLFSTLRHKSLTLVVDAASSFSSVDAQGARVVSFQGSGDHKIVNLEFDQLTDLPFPTVQIEKPVKYAVAQNQPLQISANVQSITGVAKVSFFVDNTLQLDARSTPYQFAWDNPPVGDHVISAIATDTFGRSSNIDTLHLKITLVAADADLPSQAIKAYPNPARDLLWLETPAGLVGKNADVQICDLSGRIVLSQKSARIGQTTWSIPVAELPANQMYILNLEIEGARYRATFAK